VNEPLTNELPAGIVTCVFTDVEGSTRMLRDFGNEALRALARHDDILRDVWRAHNGFEVNQLGDGFFVVFPDAADAVRGAVAVQRELGTELWTGPAVRVRIGLHTGYAVPGARANYVALAVHQTVRVMSAAHGGQILLTKATADAAGGAVRGVVLTPLGRFRVRDFDAPVALLAAAAPRAPYDGRPPRVPPADGRNIVRPVTTIVGRDDDLARVRAAVTAVRLTTILGPGGVGKTRLAVETALALVPTYADGAWFVDLAPLGDGRLVGEAIADAVGAPSRASGERWSDARDYLRDRRMLVVLDNCEHLREAAAGFAADLLGSCPGVTVLATCRRPLGLRGERVLRVAPLSSSGEGAPALDLFCQRSGRSADEPAIHELCTELDGLPLAIELAAARAASIPPAEILAQLRRRPGALQSADPTLPERQRSLSRLLDYSWGLLDSAAQRILARLSVFAGDFDIGAAEAVGAGDEIAVVDVLGHVWDLVDASLVLPADDAGDTRYRLLATVRAHAQQRVSRDERAAAIRRLAAHLLERIGPERATERGWLVEVAQELANIRAAADHVERPAIAHALTWVIGRWHSDTDRFTDGIAELVRLLTLHPEATPERAAVLTLLAELHLHTNDLDGAEPPLAEAERIVADLGAAPWDDAGVARNRCVLAMRRGDPTAAAEIATAALPRTTSAYGRARLNDVLAFASAELGDLPGALSALQTELRCIPADAIPALHAAVHGNIAETLLRLGDRAGAARHQRTALRLARESGQTVAVAFALVVAARLIDDPRRAVELQAKADDVLADAGYALYAEDARARESLLQDAATRLGADAFAAAQIAGVGLTLDAAADLAERTFDQIGSLEIPEGGHRTNAARR
jgi:predicted ATPase/class 3 adenylate cyclase